LAVAREVGIGPFDGVLFDLGFSSWQIEAAERGFAFSLDGPLDMRYNGRGPGPTAADLVNSADEEELVNWLWEYGEEARSRQIARALIRARPISTTSQLARVVESAVGRRRSAIHPATRTFQALRIAVNQELAAIEMALPAAVEALRTGGRLAVISFHSLEDRIVKRFLRRESQDCVCPPSYPVCRCDHRRTVRLLGRKPTAPTSEEMELNPRSRSAKLRLAEKV
jgi:16S rRNA (cytosine1402-N4)-methyltransferase